jgi:hypothetical protein
MYIFWDNSNIHYAGLNQVRPIIEPNAQKELYRTYFAGLLQLVAGNRQVDDIFFAGSVPPKNDALWNSVREMGIRPSLLPRSADEGEADTTDHVLQLALLRLAFDHPVPSTIAILTGDGAGIYDGQGFLADAKRLHQKGWQFEVFSWDMVCNNKLRSFAQTSGRYVKLEDYYYNITFIKHNREPKPF